MNRINIKKIKFFWSYVAPLVVYMGLIFYISSLARVGPPGVIDVSPLHIPEYFILAWLFYRMFAALELEKTSFLLAIIFTVTYGIFDEFHQSFVPGRTMSLLDMGYNTIGSGLLFFPLRKFKRKS